MLSIVEFLRQISQNTNTPKNKKVHIEGQSYQDRKRIKLKNTPGKIKNYIRFVRL